MRSSRLPMKDDMFSDEYYSKEHIGIEDNKKILRKLSPYEPKTMIDLGIGAGFYRDLYKDFIFCGIEVVDTQIERCRLNGVQVIKHDMEQKFPIDSNQFESVLMVDTMEHIYNTLGVAEEVYRILSPGGFALIQIPNIASISSRIRTLFGRRPSEIDFMRRTNGCNIGQDHISAFSVEDLRFLLTKAGFEDVKIYGYNNGRFTKYLNPLTLKGILPSLSSSIIAVAIKHSAKNNKA